MQPNAIQSRICPYGRATQEAMEKHRYQRILILMRCQHKENQRTEKRVLISASKETNDGINKNKAPTQAEDCGKNQAPTQAKEEVWISI